jgi:LysR family transcriptional regulator, low CO2-responsive transcriptional regulator
MLDLYKLALFVRVAALGSLSKAASELTMSQPAISQHMATLEQQLGTALFVRSRRGVQLTMAGQKLLGYAEAMLNLSAEAEQAMMQIEQQAAKQLAIGATPGVSAYLLPDWIEQHRQQDATLSITLHTGISPDIIAGVLEQKLDFAIIEGEIEQLPVRLAVIELATVEQLVVVGAKHRWWERTTLALTELDRQPMVMRQARSQSRIWLDRALSERGIQPQVIAEFDHMESIKRMVMMSQACAILPHYAVLDEVANAKLWAIPLVPHPLQRTLKLIWRQRTLFSPVARSFLHYLSRLYPAIQRLIASMEGKRF